MSRTSQEIRLAARPQGRPDASTWELATTEVAEPGPGEFLVQLQQISLDPAMRGWLNDVRSYLPPVQIGAVMRAFGAGTVVASQHDDFAVGDVVSGTFGVREYALSDGKGVARLDLDVAPMSTWLGALGMPGMTAWFGLEDVGRAQPGDTVLVSAAAGAVGSTVAQLAKAKGMRVVAQGRLKSRSYQDREGNNRTSWELDVDEVGPALRFATAKVTRAQRGGGGGGGFGGGQQGGGFGGAPAGGGFGGNNDGGFGGAQQGGGWGGQQQGGGQAAPQDPWSGGGGGGWDTPSSNEPPF